MKYLPSLKRLEEIRKDFTRGFVADVGFEAIRLERGFLESRLFISPRHRQQDGYIHAGVLATMADHTAGYAGYTVIPDDKRILTVEFKINFLNPAAGGEIRCRARIIREGGTIVIGESEVFDVLREREVVAAKALVTLIAVPASRIRPPAPLRKLSSYREL